MKKKDSKPPFSFTQFLHNQFHGILDANKIFYTLIYFLVAIVIGLFTIGGSNLLPIIDFITMMFCIGFLVLSCFSLISVLQRRMFQPKESLKKLGFCLIAFGIGAIPTILYFIYAKPGSIQNNSWLEYDQLLPIIYIAIFMGWNLVQIFLVKDSFISAGLNAEANLFKKHSDPETQKDFAYFYFILSLIVPIGLHIITAIGLYQVFQYKDPKNPTSIETTAMKYYIIWIIAVAIIVFLIDFWQYHLYKKYEQKQKPQIYISVFYVLIWLLLWFRSFNIINSLRSSAGGSDTFIAIGNVFLMVFTTIMVLRGLGGRIKKSRFYNEDAMPFLVFSLTILYVAGQVDLILEGFNNRATVNVFVNILVFLSIVLFYFAYIGWLIRHPKESENVSSLDSNKNDDSMPSKSEENPPIDSDIPPDLDN
jgi:hypothetical protein